jgi:hypothetical protein
MIYVQWLQTNGTVLHLSHFAGDGRWRGLCNVLDVTSMDDDPEVLWPWRREVEGRRRIAGLSRLGGWGPDARDNHPALPVCQKCLDRHAAEHQALTDWLAEHQPDDLL